MTTDRMPPPPRTVTRPRQPKADADHRAARVRPYHRHQEHHQNQPARVVRPAGPAAPVRDRAVLERVLVGLRALNHRPATAPAVPRRPASPSLALVVDNSAATGTNARPALAVVPSREAPSAPSASGGSVRSVLGRQLMPLVRAVLARRPEAAVPAAEVEPSPDSIRTQPLRVVEVGS